ncbi:MAG: AIR synthase-related protein, partial [Gammaproteobacteria bacterium]|nr:AIR synthase-related protein [Gammaproteobacteria bacterium]
SVAHEISRACAMGLRLEQGMIPVRDEVASVCEMLGYDPYYLACEGRVLAVVGPQDADAALAVWRALPEGVDAQIIGTVTEQQQRIVLATELGGERFLEELEDDPLPRIC